ncbi:Holliday junction branch migration protein RuvA [Myxococcota bacterium]|nr:Holliday junction branch migration protein RuvA [Myxococcota bacterium]
MIGWLKGQVIERTSSTLLLDVHDVGYLVTVSAQCTATTGSKIELRIHTHVREDALQLYGFVDDIEREVFELLLGVPSIGPVKAMGILATPVAELVEAVAQKNVGRLAKLPGVGKKTAERIVLDLHEKMSALRPRLGGSKIEAAPVDAAPGVREDLLSALLNLGFRPSVAEEAAASAVKRLGPDAGLQSLIRDALVHAGGR